MGRDNDAYRDVVQASRDEIIATMLDFDRYPDWQSGLLECRVRDRDEHGRGHLVEFLFDAKVRKVRYVARYSYDLDAGRLGWDYVSGDLADCTGRYDLVPRADGSTEVTVHIRTEISFYLPGPVKKLIRDQAVKNSIRDLKRRVET